ncbi:Uncharacterised protein [BD1-7 clade bacterium]|uniref:Protein kinase domain-containing protein n=1 Tax=BD1-7 clade bacterium TaxID=2029982 RepID=A0A5S9N5J1_9GAMM|nr:Uncharacterised protein [BD1-7 clade bacterium]
MMFDYSDEFLTQLESRRWRGRYSIAGNVPRISASPSQGHSKTAHPIRHAWDHVLQCRVVLKFSKPGQLFHEYRILQCLHNTQHIGRFTPIPVGQGSDGSWIATQLIPGKNAVDIQPADYPQVLQKAKQLIDCLDMLHQAGFIHGDIKPANMILLPEPMLLDFGNAMAIGHPLSCHPTPGYSPSYSSDRWKTLEGTATPDLDWISFEKWWLQLTPFLSNRAQTDSWIVTQEAICQRLKQPV